MPTKQITITIPSKQVVLKNCGGLCPHHGIYESGHGGTTYCCRHPDAPYKETLVPRYHIDNGQFPEWCPHFFIPEAECKLITKPFLIGDIISNGAGKRFKVSINRLAPYVIDHPPEIRKLLQKPIDQLTDHDYMTMWSPASSMILIIDRRAYDQMGQGANLEFDPGGTKAR